MDFIKFLIHDDLCNSYSISTRDLPDIYAQARGRGHGHIYQNNP